MDINDSLIAELVTQATTFAKMAGELIRRNRPLLVEVAATKSSDVDPVTAMDRASEDLLVQLIRAARPQDAILGEEGGFLQEGTSGLTWVIDPIDGTVNYLYGIHNYAVSVAVVSGPPNPSQWQVLAGAVHRVPDSITYSAGRGLGAERDGVPLQLGPGQPVALSLVGTGFGYDADRRRAQGRVVAELLPQVRDIRRLGSAALDLCAIADGQLDIYYERGLQAWDMAAGMLIAQEAGAQVGGLGAQVATSELTIAAHPQVYGQFARILADLGADHD